MCEKRGAHDFYVIWVKMIDLQKRLVHPNLCHVAMKKIKSFCDTKHPTKQKVKKYESKMRKWINDDKSVYTHEDHAYRFVRYFNLGIIEADEFRKNLGITKNQSVRINRKMVAIIMKIFAKEIMVRLYKIPGLSYRVDLCFVAYELVIEIDEDGHPYYENDEMRQNLIENLGFAFIRINHDPDPDAGFDPDVEIAKIYNYINESSVNLAVNSAGKSLKEKFTNELLSYMPSFSGALKCVKYFIKKILPTL